MLAKVEMWEKENIQSSQSFAQNLGKTIKETEQKLDKLVNAFLDGSIEKETYLIKKDELIKTKTDLNKRNADFGRKGNNWIEPLREWILSAHHAEKLASSNEFDEIKSFAEKIGTNRRLLDRKLIFDFVRPFDFVPKYTEKCERSPAAGGASEQTNASEFEKSLSWSGRRESNPGYKTPSLAYCHYTTPRYFSTGQTLAYLPRTCLHSAGLPLYYAPMFLVRGEGGRVLPVYYSPEKSQRPNHYDCENYFLALASSAYSFLFSSTSLLLSSSTFSA